MNDDDSKWVNRPVSVLNDDGIFPVLRSRKRIRKNAMQAMMYKPCPCGSERKFRFCCYKYKKETR